MDLMPIRRFGLLALLAGTSAFSEGPAQDPRPIFGYRFVLRGDFDGDGRQETLTERYLDGRTGEESPKYYEGVEYDELVDRAMAKDPISRMDCDRPGIPPLEIAHMPQLLGIAFARNEGDLDGDGRDEVSYVVEAADWSTLNTCHVVGLRGDHWVELAAFGIREHWLPSRPDVQSNYYLFGVAGLTRRHDTAPRQARIERRLRTWPGLIRRLGPKRIRVRTMDEGGEDCRRVLRLP